MGLIGYYLFFALKGGTTYGFSPIDFIQRPALWLETISRYRGTASSAPNFAYGYCLRPNKVTDADLAGLDLSSLRFLMTAAEPVRAPIYRAFVDRFAPYGLNPRAYFSAYGLAEYTLAVSNYGRSLSAFDADRLTENEARPTAAAGDAATMLVSCGAPLGETAVKIVDTSARPREVAAGQVGEIWITGPSKCRGYWGRPELSKEIFEAELAGDARTWLRSGDLGFLHDGELYITGRSKDVLIVRGLNYYPQDVELLVEEDAGVRKGCVAAFAWPGGDDERLVVVAEVKHPKRLPDAEAINQVVRRKLGIGVHTFVFIPARTIPKTSSGKLTRQRARSMWLDGSLKVLRQVEPATTAEATRRAAGSAGAADPVDAIFAKHGLAGDERAVPWDAGLDSIGLMELAHDVKTHLEGLGHGDLAQVVDLRLLQRIEIAELAGLLCQLTQARPGARPRFRAVFADLQRDHQQVEQATMRADTRLRFDPRRLPAIPAPDDRPGAILLTGGTGFFGPFLLKSLLEQGDEDVYVLVRADDEAAGKARLREALDQLHVPQDPAWDRRIHPVCGDLAAPRFGLSEARWAALARDVATIYHNGATVNYLFDYAAMRDVNVGGTNEVVRFALTTRAKVLNHISTTFVFGWSVKETLLESDTNQNMDLLDFGYSQTKWVSEQLVLEGMRHGVRARIFRPALITPSVSGGGHNFDISIRLLAFMLKNGLGTTAENQVSFSPADVAADNIVAIAKVPASVGGTYHVTRDRYAKMQDITAILGDLTGQDFTTVSLHEFVPRVIERCGKDDLLFPLLDFLVRSVKNITAMEFKRYDNRNYQRFRDAAASARQDPPLEDVVGGILRFMQRQGIAGAR
jgi:thioester reductase-like protein